MAIWFVLWLGLGDRYWWLTLLNLIALALFLPSLILVPLTFWLRKLAWSMLLPALLFGYLYGPYFIPYSRPLIEPTLRVLTYNVLYSNAASSEVADVIRKSKADFVALQEVQPEMMMALQEELKSTYPWSVFGGEHPFGTTAIFSRHPIILTKTLILEADRTAVVVQIDFAGQQVSFISAHLLAYNLQFVALPNIPHVLDELSAAQRRQVTVLANEVQQHEGVTLLGCDCNAQETSDSYRVLSTVMQNTARASGWNWGETPPTGSLRESRLARLDYVFFRGPVAPIGAYVIQNTGGSDHQPVLATFDLIR